MLNLKGEEISREQYPNSNSYRLNVSEDHFYSMLRIFFISNHGCMQLRNIVSQSYMILV